MIGADWVFQPDWSDQESIDSSAFEAQDTARLCGDLGNPCETLYGGAIVEHNGDPIDPNMIAPCDLGDSVTDPVILPSNDGSDRNGVLRQGACNAVFRACRRGCDANYDAAEASCLGTYQTTYAGFVLGCAVPCAATGPAFVACTLLCSGPFGLMALHTMQQCSKNAVNVRKACEGGCAAAYQACCASMPEECMLMALER